jgi:NAD(P)-dependent dehydrogenase (short-subunit alcohol dehydrogenase family)
MTNKLAVITGGANGIGRCIAEAFINSGANVNIIDIDNTAGESLKNKFSNLNFFCGDIAEKSVLENFVNTITQPVDFLINNAYQSRKGLLSECTWEDFEYVQRIGVTAPYYLTSLLLKKNLLSKGASVINIASTRAFQSQPDTESYSAAKGGIIALTHAMAVSLSGRARVNSISPGWIDVSDYHENMKPAEFSDKDKEQHLSGRIGKPEDISAMVLYLCSEHAGFITGENIAIDGGMSKLMIYHNDFGWKLS